MVSSRKVMIIAMAKKNKYVVSFVVIKDGAPTTYINEKEVRAYSTAQAHFFVLKEYKGRGYIRDFSAVLIEDNSNHTPKAEQLTLFG